MSRSRRKPFFYPFGGQHIKDDRQRAARSARRTQDAYVRDCFRLGEYDDMLVPHRLECSFNNRYSWSCDSARARPDYDGYSGMYAGEIGVYLQTPEQLNCWRREACRRMVEEAASPNRGYLRIQRK